MNKPSLKTGDRVKYRREFCRSIGALTGPIPFARGTILELIETPARGFTLARIQWDKPSDLLDRVNVGNLIKASSLEA